MIIDQSRRLRGTSVSRLSEYLSLCKIDCLVRNIADAMPSRRVDQPSKVGQAGTMSQPVTSARSRYSVKVDYNLKLGNRNRTLLIKNEMSRKLRVKIGSLSEAGTVILQQDGKDIDRLSLYSLVVVADSFAFERKEWKVCLAFNKQELWVNAFLNLLRKSRRSIDYLILINNGQIRNYMVPESQGGS